MSDDSFHIDRRQLLQGAAGTASLLLTTSLRNAMAATNGSIATGRSQSFDLGWRFFRGSAEGLESSSLDDKSWRIADVPHDWSIEDLSTPLPSDKARVVGAFDRDAQGGTATGFTVGGEGWYRKHFRLDYRALNHFTGRVEILFDGIYNDSEMWINGHHLGTHLNGYTPVAYDLTPHLSPTGDNVLAVRVRNLGKNSRWYAGSGIYRHVWLDVLPEQSRIARWGVGVATKHIVDDRADIEITTRFEDLGDGLTLVSRVKDINGTVVAEVSSAAKQNLNQNISIKAPLLWSPVNPNLYTLESELRRGNRALDNASNTFGVRIIMFSSTEGMTINGVPTKLRGGCIHHDHGLLGAAAFDAAEARKVRLLKARGFNAVRPSHNPFSPAFLRACNEQGMLVVAETFDVWSEQKLPQDYSVRFAEQWQHDLSTMVLSARNHPSIVMWSIGNEIPGRTSSSGVETQWHLANHVRTLDPTRPVTAAIHGFVGRDVLPSQRTARVGFAGIADQSSVVFLDVVGYNYKLDDYESDHRRYPQRILFGTESFPKDVAAIWALTDQSPWLIGDFVWTAMDYLGEAGIGGSAVLAEKDARNPMAVSSGWPWVNAFCGDIDLIGRQKPQSLLRDVIWGVSKLEVAVQRPAPDGKVDVPRQWGWHDEQRSWSWPAHEGRQVVIRIYTSGNRIELRINGKPVAAQSVTPNDLKQVSITATYEPGVLEVVAFQDETEIARKQLTTVGAPAAVRLVPEQDRGGARRGDVNYVAVEIVDEQGQVVPDAVRSVTLNIAGAAELIGFGCANPMAVGSFQTSLASTWDGRALAIIRGMGRKGRIRVVAHSEGLRDGIAPLTLE
jgi:beta-galactosidase